MELHASLSLISQPETNALALHQPVGLLRHWAAQPAFVRHPQTLTKAERLHHNGLAPALLPPVT